MKELGEKRKRIVAIKEGRVGTLARINTKKKEIEDIEMDIGTLKAQVLHNPQMYDL